MPGKHTCLDAYPYADRHIHTKTQPICRQTHSHKNAETYLQIHIYLCMYTYVYAKPPIPSIET